MPGCKKIPKKKNAKEINFPFFCLKEKLNIININ